MPATQPMFNDLSLPVGTFTASLGGASFTPVTYYCENFSYSNQQTVTNVPNEIGAIRGRIINDVDKGGSMTLTLPSTAATSFPRLGLTGSIPPGFASGSAVNFMIAGIDQSRTPTDYGKVNVQWLIANP